MFQVWVGGGGVFGWTKGWGGGDTDAETLGVRVSASVSFAPMQRMSQDDDKAKARKKGSLTHDHSAPDQGRWLPACQLSDVSSSEEEGKGGRTKCGRRNYSRKNWEINS